MKRHYDTPNVTIMHLKPEEKLAICEWPIGFTTTGSTGCAKTWQQVPAYSSMCTSMYNNAPVSGS